ncbi:MAG: hypothetical protein LKI76_05010 [Megasphaera sp.]|jgi:hypothetical protein|nr:hypothetical protein [Megasphaera sp.]
MNDYCTNDDANKKYEDFIYNTRKFYNNLSVHLYGTVLPFPFYSGKKWYKSMECFTDSIFKDTMESENQAINNFIHWILDSPLILDKFGKIKWVYNKKKQFQKQLTKRLRKIVKISKEILQKIENNQNEDVCLIIYQEQFKELIKIPFWLPAIGDVHGAFLLEFYLEHVYIKYDKSIFDYCCRDVYKYLHTSEKILDKNQWQEPPGDDFSVPSIEPEEYRPYLKLKKRIQDRRDKDSPICNLFERFHISLREFQELKDDRDSQCWKLCNLLEYIQYEWGKNGIDDRQNDHSNNDKSQCTFNLNKLLGNPHVTLFSNPVNYFKEPFTKEQRQQNEAMIFLFTEVKHQCLLEVIQYYQYYVLILKLFIMQKTDKNYCLNFMYGVSEHEVGQYIYQSNIDDQGRQYYHAIVLFLQNVLNQMDDTVKTMKVTDKQLFNAFAIELLKEKTISVITETKLHHRQAQSVVQVIDANQRAIFVSLCVSFGKGNMKEAHKFLICHEKEVSQFIHNDFKKILNKAIKYYPYIDQYHMGVPKNVKMNSCDLKILMAIMQLEDKAMDNSIDDVKTMQDHYGKKRGREKRSLHTILSKFLHADLHEYNFLRALLTAQIMYDLGWIQSYPEWGRCMELMGDVLVKNIRGLQNIDQFLSELNDIDTLINEQVRKPLYAAGVSCVENPDYRMIRLYLFGK